MSASSADLESIEESHCFVGHKLAVFEREHHIDLFVARAASQGCGVDHEATGFVVVVIFSKEGQLEH